MVVLEKAEVYDLLKKYPTSDEEINIADALIAILRGEEKEPEDEDY